jgi:hypothetical protein
MTRSTVPLLALFTILVLILVGCGGGGGATPANTTAGGGTTSAETTAAGGGGTVPAEMASSTVELTPTNNSGVTGTATLTNTSSGVAVVLNVQNLQDQPRSGHLAHIHQGGTCADDRAGNGAPVRYPLNSVMTEQGGTGMSTTEIPGVSVAQLFSGTAKYVDVHDEQHGDETPLSISCADLTTRQD